MQLLEHALCAALVGAYATGHRQGAEMVRQAEGVGPVALAAEPYRVIGPLGACVHPSLRRHSLTLEVAAVEVVVVVAVVVAVATVVAVAVAIAVAVAVAVVVAVEVVVVADGGGEVMVRRWGGGGGVVGLGRARRTYRIDGLRVGGELWSG